MVKLWPLKVIGAVLDPKYSNYHSVKTISSLPTYNGKSLLSTVALPKFHSAQITMFNLLLIVL